MIFIVVVFPAPFGPRNPRISPVFTSNEMLSTAFWSPYSLVRFRTAIDIVDRDCVTEMLESVTPKRDKSKKGVNKKQAKRVWAFNALLGRLKELNLKTDGNGNPGDVYATPCAQLSRHRRWSVLVGRKKKIASWPEPASFRALV